MVVGRHSNGRDGRVITARFKERGEEGGKAGQTKLGASERLRSEYETPD